MSQTNGQSPKLRRITQEVIIRTLEPGANRTLRGYIQDRAGSGASWVITNSLRLYPKDQVPSFEKELIIDFSPSMREKRYSYEVVYNAEGVVDETKMLQKHSHIKNCMEAYRTMHSQVKVHGMSDMAKCKEINPNLMRPIFSIEFVGYDQVDKALTLCEQAKVFNEFFALSKEFKLQCCYHFGYNPVKLEAGKEPVKPKVSTVLNVMVDFNKGILMKPEKRKEFLQVYLPLKEKHAYTATIKAAIALNIVSWKVNAFFVNETNVGFSEPAVFAYMESYPNIFETVKEEVEKKQLEIEDDWSDETVLKNFDVEQQITKNEESMALNATNRKLEEDKIRQRAKLLGHKYWANTGTDKLQIFIDEEELKLKIDAGAKVANT